MIKFIDVYDKALIKLRKEQSGLGIKPSEFARMIPDITERHFDNIVSSYNKNEDNTTQISRFFKTYTSTKNTTDSDSVYYKLPSDYAHHRGIVFYKENNDSENFPTYKTIDILQDNEYIESMKSTIFKPERYKEKAIIDYIIEPLSTSASPASQYSAVRVLSDRTFNGSSASIKLPYIRKPDELEFNYNTGDSNGIPTLSQADENGFDFDDGDSEALVDIVLELASLGLKRPDLYQYSKANQMEDMK